MTAFLYYFILLSQKYGTQTCAVFFYAPRAGLEPQGGARDEKTHRVFPERTSDLRSRSRRMRRRRIRCPIRGANPLLFLKSLKDHVATNNDRNMDKDFLRLDEIANISCHVKDEMCLIFIQCL